jgi:hypothetical protein
MRPPFEMIQEFFYRECKKIASERCFRAWEEMMEGRVCWFRSWEELTEGRVHCFRAWEEMMEGRVCWFMGGVDVRSRALLPGLGGDDGRACVLVYGRS